MNVKLKVLRKVLEEAINNIDAGNSNHSDDELDDICCRFCCLYT